MTAKSCARERLAEGRGVWPELLMRGFGDSSVPGPAAQNRIAFRGSGGAKLRQKPRSCSDAILGGLTPPKSLEVLHG